MSGKIQGGNPPEQPPRLPDTGRDANTNQNRIERRVGAAMNRIRMRCPQQGGNTQSLGRYAMDLVTSIKTRYNSMGVRDVTKGLLLLTMEEEQLENRGDWYGIVRQTPNIGDGREKQKEANGLIRLNQERIDAVRGKLNDLNDFEIIEEHLFEN